MSLLSQNSQSRGCRREATVLSRGQQCGGEFCGTRERRAGALYLVVSGGLSQRVQSWRRRGRGGSRWRKQGRAGSRRVFRAHHMLLISPAIRVDSGLWASSPATEMVHEGPVGAICSGPSPRTLVSQHPPLPHPSRSIPWPF